MNNPQLKVGTKMQSLKKFICKNVNFIFLNIFSLPFYQNNFFMLEAMIKDNIWMAPWEKVLKGKLVACNTKRVGGDMGLEC